MSRIRRSLTVTAVASLLLSGLAVSASADQVPAAVRAPSAEAPSPVVAAPEADGIARGLIVKTTTSDPSEALLDAADDALGSQAEIVGDATISGTTSSVAFDEPVSADLAADVAETVERRSDVVWAVPDTMRQISANPPVTTNDSLFAEQWALWDRSVSKPAGGFSLKAPALWPVTTGSPEVRVAVLDTGVRTSHPELSGRLVPGYDMIAADRSKSRKKTYFVANDGNGRDASPSDPGDWARKGQCYRRSPAYDSSWHGTFIAGQIVARSGNGSGIAGVAPGVKVQPVRVLGRCGGWDSDILAGIRWASGGHVNGVPDNQTPAQVVNLSLGSLYRTAKDAAKACKPYAEAATQAMSRGSLLVVAAGNEFAEASEAVPAACNGFLTVGATSRKGYRAAYSNKGKKVDIAAPGGDSWIEGGRDLIVSLGNKGRTRPSTNGYLRYEGTSMSTAYVSAGAALLYSLGLDDPREVRAALIASTSAFPRKSSSRERYRKKSGGRTYTFNLNCGYTECGKGILDLSKVQAPLEQPTVSGTQWNGQAVVGQELTYTQRWAGPEVGVRWYREQGLGGERELIGEGPTYIPTWSDVGHALSVESVPGGAFRPLRTRVDIAGTVFGTGVTVSLEQDHHQQGRTFPVIVNLSSVADPDRVVEDGDVEVLYGDDVVATGRSTSGHATIDVPADAWRPGSIDVRARYVGTSATPPGTSPSRQASGYLPDPEITLAVASPQVGETPAVVTVTVSAPDGFPPGTVWIHPPYNENYLLARATLSSEADSPAQITMPLQGAGASRLVATYYSSERAAVSSNEVVVTTG
ncbi:S8 family serine peptidase [Aeromicrobium stalagmiti]|uniref:S8 family serine peptidase n=1 Tax=Aeromicrobium stalagmiti TaxID=2738988 RepID=UPI001567E03B|nr:S8 family serine peptidase [Aeromicrobium stalagmiti]NRQ49731.1 S8 family serine peptidase [Aeromicrobium stalagmiti]